MSKEIISEIKTAIIVGALESMNELIAREKEIADHEISTGLRGEEIMRLGRSDCRHSNGAATAIAQEKAYNGGRSVADGRD